MCFVFIWEQTATCATNSIHCILLNIVVMISVSHPILHSKLIGFYNRDEKCLLRGTDWVFK
jgi:hypothetical protein